MISVVLSFVDDNGKDVEYRQEMNQGDLDNLLSDFLSYSTKQYEFWYDGQLVEDD